MGKIKVKIKIMAYIPKTFLYVEWPHSQRIMQHPEAKKVENKYTNSLTYIIPPEVWEKYKDTYYYNPELFTEDEENMLNEYNFDDEREAVLDRDNDITYDTEKCETCGLVDNLKNTYLMIQCNSCNEIQCELCAFGDKYYEYECEYIDYNKIQKEFICTYCSKTKKIKPKK